MKKTDSTCKPPVSGVTLRDFLCMAGVAVAGLALASYDSSGRM